MVWMFHTHKAHSCFTTSNNYQPFLYSSMMMVADKPRSIPSVHFQSPTKIGQQNAKSSNTPSKQSPPKKQQQQQQQQQQKTSRKKQQQQPRQQDQPQVKTKQTSSNSNASASTSSKQKSSSSKKSNSRKDKRDTSNVVIPPRAVAVDFHGSKRATLKSTSDEIKVTAQDLRNLILSDSIQQSLPNGAKPDFGHGNTSTRTKQTLPDGSKPDFGHGNSKAQPLSRSSSSGSSSSTMSSNRSKLHSSSSNSSNSTPNGFRYAGSSFHAEPKAVTLPKPSFLRKQ